MRRISLFFILALFVLTSPATAQEYKIKSVYPIPIGIHEQLQLVPQTSTPPCKEGMLYFQEGETSAFLCSRQPDGSLSFGYLSGIWAELNTSSPLHQHFVYITSSSPENLKLHIGTPLTYDSPLTAPDLTKTFKLTLDDYNDIDRKKNQDAGIMAKGNGQNNQVPVTGISGPSALFLWYPLRSALWAGNLDTGISLKDSNIGSSSVAFGSGSFASGTASTVSGGMNNLAQGNYSAIGGGQNNQALSNYSNIIGGDGNIIFAAISENSFIGGGHENTIVGPNSVIVGGYKNMIDFDSALAKTADTTSTIGGGEQNLIQGVYGTILGGKKNTLIGSPNLSPNNTHNTIGGGDSNQINGAKSFIGGGQNNEVVGNFSTIGGGGGPTVSGSDKNKVSGNYSTIIGGMKNILESNYGFIGGGRSNHIATTSDYSAVAGGFTNTIEGPWSFIGGGNTNDASGSWATIIGGRDNTASGDNAFIGGGRNNNADGNFAIVAGGQDNSANGDYSWAGGRNMKIIPRINGGVPVLNFQGKNTFAWGYSDTPVTIDKDYSFIIFPGTAGHARIGATATPDPNVKLHVVANSGQPIAMKITGGLYLTSLQGAGPNRCKLVLDTTAGPTLGTISQSTNAQGSVCNDLAETFETTNEVSVGDVLVIDSDSAQKLKKSYSPYDQKVVGVVSEVPAALLDGTNTQFSPGAQFTKGTKPPVALAGRVKCKVSLENGPIEYGDLLTTSSIPGYAMKASEKNKSFGAIIGKALEPFDGSSEGKKEGMIIIFVSLQ